MNVLFLITLATSIALTAAAATPTPFNLYPTTAPNETHPIGPETSHPDGTQLGCGILRNQPCQIINNVSTPTLTAYLVNNGTGAAVVIAPGGGYTLLAYDKEGKDIARMYNSIGVSAFLLKYRVPARAPVEGLPKWWAALQDAQRAIRLVRHGVVTGKWNRAVNASRIGFAGFSAGGHLTGHVSTSKKCAYRKIDAADAMKHRPDWSIFGYPWMLLPNNKEIKYGQAYTLADEFKDIDATHPVSMFVHNEDDPIAPVQGTLVYVQKLKSVGAPLSTVYMAPKGRLYNLFFHYSLHVFTFSSAVDTY